MNVYDADEQDNFSPASDVHNKKDNKRRIIANIFKAYHGDFDKYSGAICDNPDRKFTMVLERCD